MQSASVNLLDIVCGPAPEVPFLHRLAMVAHPGCASARIRTFADGRAIENAVIAGLGNDANRAVVAIPDVTRKCPVTIAISPDVTFTVDTGPVADFEIVLMPSSHLCFGYNTCLPEHIEAGCVVASAVAMLERHPDYRWNIEFVRGAQKLFSRYPDLADAARRQYAQGRLGIGALWTPAIFEHYDAEAAIRQLVEAQWWLRENFGAISPILMGCDSSGFDPQQPQVMRQAGIEFYWRCRYTLIGKDFGSPFIEHEGADGTKLPCFTSRPPIAGKDSYNGVPMSQGQPAWRGPRADRSDPKGFAELIQQIDEYLRNTREICGVNCNFHFPARDQGRADADGPATIAAWNSIFRTPRASFASIVEAKDKILKMAEFKCDRQEPEQPHWGATAIAGYPLTLPFQQTSYALCTAEKAATIDLFANGAPYPAEELRAAWMNILNEQHHEQLGYGARDQVEHAREKIRRSLFIAESITRDAALRTANKIAFTRPAPALVVFNYLNWRRRDIVEAGAADPGIAVVDARGHPVPCEITEQGRLRFIAEVEGTGYNTYYAEPSAASPKPASDLKGGDTWIENAFYRVEVDGATGCVREIYDKELQTTIADGRGTHRPFELVVNEDAGDGYCVFRPTGRLWRCSEIGGALARMELTGLAARIVVERPLLAHSTEARFGDNLLLVYELPTQTKRLDVTVTAGWDSEPKRELRLFLPLAMRAPKISYDTLLASSDYDPDLPARQHLRKALGEGREMPDSLYDYRYVTRFVSAYDSLNDLAVTVTAPHGLWRVEESGISFTLIEDRTDVYWKGLLMPMKGRHTFSTSLTSHRGNWRAAQDWRLGWERRSAFNPLLAVTPARLYPVLPEAGQLVKITGTNLVLTALKVSHFGEDMIARVYDANGQGGLFGLRLTTPYLGLVPYRQGGGPSPAAANANTLNCKVKDVFVVNLLEDVEQTVDANDLDQGKVSVKPYGILTARIGFEMPNHALG